MCKQLLDRSPEDATGQLADTTPGDSGGVLVPCFGAQSTSQMASIDGCAGLWLDGDSYTLTVQ